MNSYTEHQKYYGVVTRGRIPTCDSISVAEFPPVGTTSDLEMVNGRDNTTYTINTKYRKSTGVANRKIRTIVHASTTVITVRSNGSRVGKIVDEYYVPTLTPPIFASLGGSAASELGRAAPKFASSLEHRLDFIRRICPQAFHATVPDLVSPTTEKSVMSSQSAVNSGKSTRITLECQIKSAVKRVNGGLRTDLASRKNWSTTPDSKKTQILKGMMQAGKTAWMISRALMDVYLNGITSIMVLRALNADQEQLTGRIRRFNEECSAESVALGFGEVTLVDIIDDMEILYSRSDQDKIDIFSGASPVFITCISNETRLKKIYDITASATNPQFTMYIDEADMVDSSAESTMKTAKGKLISKLKVMCANCVLVSATVIENLFGNDIVGTDVVILEPPHIYKGPRQFTWKLSKGPMKYGGCKGSNYSENCGLRYHYTKMGKMKVYGDDAPTRLSQPGIHLINVGRITEDQFAEQKRLYDQNKDICSAVYNGSGLTFYHRRFIGPTLTIGGVTMKRTGKFYKGQVSIGNMLAFLQDKGTAFTGCIVIYSGMLAGRGLSFVSSSMVKGIGWHINWLYMAVSDSMTSSNLLQAIGRLCGCFNDQIPLYLVMDKKGLDDAWNSFALQEKTFEEALVTSRAVGTTMKSSMLECSMSEKQRGTRSHSASVKYNVFKKIVSDVDAPDWGAPTLMNKRARKAAEEATAGMAALIADIAYSKHAGYGTRETIQKSMEEVGADEIARLVNRFKVWSKPTNQSVIAVWMRKLDTRRSYTSAEINSCKSGWITDVTNSPIDGHRGNGNIMQKFGETGYRLHPCLREMYAKIF